MERPVLAGLSCGSASSMETKYVQKVTHAHMHIHKSSCVYLYELLWILTVQFSQFYIHIC